MYFAGVVFPESNGKVYWFILPFKFFDRMLNGGKGMIGSKVLAQTACGEQIAVISAVMEMKDEQSIQDVFPNITLPMRRIIATQGDVTMNNIKLPDDLHGLHADPVKIARRVEEWYAGNGFKTMVKFSQDRELKDGYTAYLVAKMFGATALKGFMT